MGQAIPLGNDYTADQLRRLARQKKTRHRRVGCWRSRRCSMGLPARRLHGSAGWTVRRCGIG